LKIQLHVREGKTAGQTRTGAKQSKLRNPGLGVRNGG
jgi:hypothetical protein